MPWTVADVDKHKKGLTARQKRQWVDVANSALAKCQREGGSNCDASAIKQANAVVHTHEFTAYHVQNNSYAIRQEMFEGRSHIVVPVIMMVEGVHEGSHGPLLHLADDLGRFPAAWDGIPVTIDHPQDEGEFISATSPDVIERSGVGRVFNTRMEDGKLKAEAWIDLNKIEQLSSEAMEYIRNGKPLEVSVGVFTDEESTAGEWNSERYEAIARNHRPNHLALLPGGTGACSWRDGCGIRANKQKGGDDVDEKVIIAKKLLSIEGMPQINEQGYREVLTAIQAKLDRMDDDAKVHFLTEVYEDNFVYEVRGRDSVGAPTPAFYKREYSVDDNGAVEFTGEAQQVTRKIEYVTVQKGMVRTKDLKKKEVTNMSDKDKQVVTCQEKVDALIKSEHSTFTENDREWLGTIGDEYADKLIAMQAAPAPAEKEEKKDEPLSKEEAIQALTATLKDPKKFLEILPDDIADSVRSGLKLNEERRTNMIAAIREAEPDGYSEEELKGRKTDELEMLIKYIKPQVNYAPLGSGDGRSGDVEPMLPTDVQAEIAANEQNKQKTAE